MKTQNEVLRLIAAYGRACRKTRDAEKAEDAAKAKLLARLCAMPLGEHPAIDHHIVNTEGRRLSGDEREFLVSRTYGR